MAITIGADPEVFIAVDGKIVGAHEFTGLGTKARPLQRGAGGSIQVDGLAMEFNTRPAFTSEEFQQAVTDGMQNVTDAVRARRNNAEVLTTPSHKFDPTYYAGIPRAAKALGCDPDFDAWTSDDDKQCPRILPAAVVSRTNTVRHTGGHIHIGWTRSPMTPDDPVLWDAHIQLCRKVVRELDYWVGVPLSALNVDRSRLAWYGRPGIYRPKSYGVEYRTPSNVWLNAGDLTHFVFSNSMCALRAIQSPKLMMQTVFRDYPPHLVFDAECPTDASFLSVFLARVGAERLVGTFKGEF